MPGSASIFKIVVSDDLPNEYRIILSKNGFDEYMVELFHDGKRIEQLEWGDNNAQEEASAEYNLIRRVLNHVIKTIKPA